MTASLEHVKPGDLITADLVNRLMDRIEALEKRVQELEGSTKYAGHPAQLELG